MAWRVDVFIFFYLYFFFNLNLCQKFNSVMPSLCWKVVFLCVFVFLNVSCCVYFVFFRNIYTIHIIYVVIYIYLLKNIVLNHYFLRIFIIISRKMYIVIYAISFMMSNGNLSYSLSLKSLHLSVAENLI